MQQNSDNMCDVGPLFRTAALFMAPTTLATHAPAQILGAWPIMRAKPTLKVRATEFILRWKLIAPVTIISTLSLWLVISGSVTSSAPGTTLQATEKAQLPGNHVVDIETAAVMSGSRGWSSYKSLLVDEPVDDSVQVRTSARRAARSTSRRN